HLRASGSVVELAAGFERDEGRGERKFAVSLLEWVDDVLGSARYIEARSVGIPHHALEGYQQIVLLLLHGDRRSNVIKDDAFRIGGGQSDGQPCCRIQHWILDRGQIFLREAGVEAAGENQQTGAVWAQSRGDRVGSVRVAVTPQVGVEGLQA